MGTDDSMAGQLAEVGKLQMELQVGFMSLAGAGKSRGGGGRQMEITPGGHWSG